MSRRAWRGAGLALAVLLAACAKPIPQEHRDMVGVWEGPGMHLAITAEGRVSYRRVRGNGNVSIEAPIQQIRPDGFTAGVGPMNTQFRIDAGPKQHENGTWTMTVDGVELTRVDAGAGSGNF